MRIFNLLILCFLFTGNGIAENYLLNGGQKSVIRYELVQMIEPTKETVTVDATFVVPQSFSSPTYTQQIEDFNLKFSIPPEKQTEKTDNRGNKIITCSWTKPARSFEIKLQLVARNSVSLAPIKTTDPFPVSGVPTDLNVYLTATDQVPANNPDIKKTAKRLVAGSKTQFDAVQKILSWVIDHMQYVLTPKEHGALYAFETGKGNCQNYSHLAGALMRSQGIPVRIVNGVTLKKPFDVRLGERVLTLNMAQGRHSWIEVFFPQLGWMPFDPQQTEMFVSNRFIRAEVGLDNNETKNDGFIRWTRQKGSTALLNFQESIAADFETDEVAVNGSKQKYGPKKLLLLPVVEAQFVPVTPPVVKKIPEFDPAKLQQMKFDKNYVAGNLEFPEGVNFAYIRDTRESADGRTQELQKNFLVETAEYVTSRKRYAQAFNLDIPVLLKSVALALHKFGGEGQLWLELREESAGGPGEVAAVSRPVDLKTMSLKPGYRWIEFDFAAEGLVLTPDRYWISLNYRGSPIVNWFYSYGKPVGDIDGTRVKRSENDNWDTSLGFEFNFRIRGMRP